MKTKARWRVVPFSIVAFVAISAETRASGAETPGVTASLRADREINPRMESDFIAFDPDYRKKKAERVVKARSLGKQVIAREQAGQNTQLSHQILSEIIWLISSTADFNPVDRRLDDLQTSLDHPEREPTAEEQDPKDGSWGKGYTEWFFKLAASFPNLEKETKFKFQFLDRINSPTKLTHYFRSVSVSDISHTGIDHEREFNESLSYLMRMILREKPKTYRYHPDLKATLMDLVLHRLRNPKTGFWGERYVRDGRLQFVDNLSITFHVVSYLDGKVPDMEKVVATTLAIKEKDFPAGWLLNGKYWDHLNMDVAELFRLGWSHASDPQKKAIATELNKMLRWCLTESLQADGSFKFVEGDNSREEGTYYGASFLARIGFFDRSKRFWTDQDFPEAENVRQKIVSYIEKHRKNSPTGGDYYTSALKQLNDRADLPAR